MDQGKKEAFYNRSLERALRILDVFKSERQALSVARLSEILNLPRATVLRLCTTLVSYGYLKQDRESKRYALGLKLFELGSIVFHSFSLRNVASPHLSRLQTSLGKTIFLGILENDELFYIDKIEDLRNPIVFTSKIGTCRPPYWGMMGPLLMSYLPDSEIERLLKKSPLKATTKHSITKKEKFIKWLRRIRQLEYVIESEMAIPGIAGVAVPIRDFTGKVIAALGIGFMSSSVDSKGTKKILNEARKTAAIISLELGYHEKKEKPGSPLKSLQIGVI